MSAAPAARLFASALFLASAGSAPFQCGGNSKPDPAHRLEDEPAEGLYDLANQYHAEGNEKARVEALEFIVKRYPSSRFAEMARLDLGQGHAASSAAP